MDVLRRVTDAFLDAVLSETDGSVLHLNAQAHDLQLYSKNARTLESLVVTNHSAEAVERLREFAPTRPRTTAFRVDLQSDESAIELLHLATSCRFDACVWNVECTSDLPNVLSSLSTLLVDFGTVYTIHMDARLARQLALSHPSVCTLLHNGLRYADGHVRRFPSACVDEFDRVAREQCMHCIFRQSLEQATERLCLNVLPCERASLVPHIVSAYSAPMRA